jgi:hypothetical protein
MNNECHLFRDKNDNIIAWIAVDFDCLKEFTEIVGIYVFEDGGIEVTMMNTYIAIELNDIVENNDEDLSEYKECFGSEWD